MALPTEQNITVLRGTDNDLQFTIADASGTAIDISLDTITFTGREGFAGPIRVPKKSNAPGTHTDPTNGVTTFKLLKTEIDDEVQPGSETSWKYEVRRVEAVTLDEFVHFQGGLIIKPAVTEG